MNSPVVFFDDLCILCSRSVRFIYRNDRKARFFFAAVNSDEFKHISAHFPADRPVPDSVILYNRGKVFSRSGAALRIAWQLRFPYPLLAIAFIIPPFLRDGLYDWIARKRYGWFGKRNTCFLPDGGMKERFLD